MDLRKAFEKVDHSILLKKIEFYDIRCVSGDFLKSYLSSRSQFVSLSNCIFFDQIILCGVLQGSVLAPIHFHIYVNDIVYTSEIFKFCTK